MTSCRVVVAAYAGLGSALADWDDLERAQRADGVGLVDAALVEGDADTIRVFHRHSRTCDGRGSVAGAVVGLLRPPAIVAGAVAGGVGEHVLILVGQSLSRNSIKELGDAMDSGPIALVALTHDPEAGAWDHLLGAAGATASASSTMSVGDIRRAIDGDAAQ
jgi:uncharacterized membrane protein